VARRALLLVARAGNASAGPDTLIGRRPFSTVSASYRHQRQRSRAGCAPINRKVRRIGSICTGRRFVLAASVLPRGPAAATHALAFIDTLRSACAGGTRRRRANLLCYGGIGPSAGITRRIDLTSHSSMSITVADHHPYGGRQHLLVYLRRSWRHSQFS